MVLSLTVVSVWCVYLQGVKETPNSNYVWQILGTLRVKKAGKYKLCTISDDG